MSRLAALLAFTLATSVTVDAAAQCCGFGRIRPGRPDAVVATGFQKAFIYHANGVERIVLQPSYRGVAKDFGVFLAVPEIPIIEKADAALFTELERLIPKPRVARRAMAQAAESAKSEDSWQGVSVIQQQLVGMYEASTLQASDRRSFTDWLKKNGYKWDPRLEPVFDHYVKAGWFFVAMKVNRNVPKASRFSGPIQPVSVRFTQDEILMPMKLTSLTPGGVDFMYYLITDTEIAAKNIRAANLVYKSPLSKTAYNGGAYPKLDAFLKGDILRTRQDDLAKTSKSVRSTVETKMLERLWLTKFQGHFNLADLGDDFVWEPAGKGRSNFADALTGDSKQAYLRGMRRIKSVRFIADVFDTNKGYGKPTFVNGIHIGDLAAIGGEGSNVWKEVTIDLPKSVVHWLKDRVRVKVENYGLEKANGRRYVDAYNLRNVRIVVDYDDGETWTSKKFEGPVCSVPKWKNCQGRRVSKWGAPVEIQF